MARLIRAHDWSESLGPIADWPTSLKTTVDLMVQSPVPLVLLWGECGIMIYNDAYGVFAGNRHPGLLGSKVLEGWPEAADLNRHVMATCMAGGTLEYKDTELVLNRRGRFESGWMDLFYSPVIDESGKPGGVIAVVVETTERVLTRRAAVEQGERLAQMFQDAPSFMCYSTGPDHVFTFTNAAYQQLISHRNVIGKAVRDALPELAGQGFYELLDQVYSTGESYRGYAVTVTLQRTPDSAPQQRLLDFIYQPVRDSTGAITGIFTEGYDVTERKNAEIRREALVKMTDRIRDLESPNELAFAASTILGETLGVSRVSYGTIDHDAETLTVDRDWLAPGVESLAGTLNLRDYGSFIDSLKAGEFIAIADVDKDARTASAAAALKSRSAGAFVNVPVLEKGRLVAVLFLNNAKARDWTNDDLSLVQEIAERTRTAMERIHATNALREANIGLEAKVLAHSLARGRTWQLSPDLIGVLNGQGIFETTNPAWQVILGWSEREIASTRFFDFIHPDDQARTRVAWEAAMERGEAALRFENRYRHRNGGYRWLSWVAVPDEGKVYCSARDITLEKEREAELLQAQDALRQAQKMEAVGQLTGGIAHDFNNMLQGITGALDRVQHRIAEGRPADADRFLKAAMDSASRAAALTHRLLAFSRRQTLDPRPIEVNRLIGGMEELIRRTMGPNVEVEVVGAAGAWPIRIDPSQLENSLLNLCINARDAMPEGGKLVIETANKWLDDRTARDRDIPAGQYVSLCVTDTGTGMTPEVMERVFDPFYTTKPIGHGTGLGLSMVYGFVRQSGGQVRIYSELGKGTTMCLYFPRHLGAAEEREQQPSETMEHGFGETVLLVDDDPTVRMLLAEVLTESGYKLLEAGDGASALRHLGGSQRIDMMVTDVGLPGGMNGRQVADAARTMRPDLKVLFITGYAENAAITSGHLEAGMQVLAKPFAMSTLANKVREMLER
jgi:PAS domain S-box-containing protein